MLHLQNFTLAARKLVICSILVLCSMASSADWKIYFDEADIIALVECSKISDDDEKMTVLKCYKGDLKIGDELKLTSYFRNEVGIFGRAKFIIFGELKDDVTSTVVYDVETALKVTSNKIWCDLYHQNRDEKTPGSSLKEFNRFLEAYGDSTLRPSACRKILGQLSRLQDSRKATLYLMQLYLLGYDQFDPIFRILARARNTGVRYALIHLMGNIHTDDSRAVLTSILSSSEMWLVGIAIQILANEPPEFAGPILLERFKVWSHEDLKSAICDNQVYQEGSDIDWGVYSGFAHAFSDNTVIKQEEYRSSRGKWEVVYAFGKLRYQPAGPDLVSFLDRCGYRERLDVMDVLGLMEYRDYTKYINRQLDRNSEDNIHWIMEYIIEDTLVECLPSLMNYISRVNRTTHCNWSFLVSPDEGIGAFSDSTARNFLLQDFGNFLDHSASLDCKEVHEWNAQYINSFSANREERARPLINRLFFESFGYNEDFGLYPDLFRIKKELEDSAMVLFQNKLEKTGYTWVSLKRCIAYIENTQEVMQGQSPKVHYAVECEVVDKTNSINRREIADFYAEIIHKELDVSVDSIALVIGYYLYSDYMLPKSTWIVSNSFENPMLFPYSKYFIENPTLASVGLFKALLANNYIVSPREIESLNQTIQEMELKLNQN